MWIRLHLNRLQLATTSVQGLGRDGDVLLQNHIMGRLSMNSCLMAGGSTWFVRKRWEVHPTMPWTSPCQCMSQALRVWWRLPLALLHVCDDSAFCCSFIWLYQNTAPLRSTMSMLGTLACLT